MHAAQVSTDYASEDKLFWLSWVVTTTLGWFIGWWVGFFLGWLFATSMLVVLAGAGAGLMQWWMLRVHYPAPAQRWQWWALITGSVLVWLLRQSIQPGAAPGWACPPVLIAASVVALLPILLVVLHALAYRLSPPQYRDLPMDGDAVRRVAFSPDGRLLVTAAPYDVRLWEVATGRARDVQPGVAGMVADVTFSPDGTLLAIADGATVQLWDVRPLTIGP